MNVARFSQISDNQNATALLLTAGLSVKKLRLFVGGGSIRRNDERQMIYLLLVGDRQLAHHRIILNRRTTNAVTLFDQTLEETKNAM